MFEIAAQQIGKHNPSKPSGPSSMPIFIVQKKRNPSKLSEPSSMPFVVQKKRNPSKPLEPSLMPIVLTTSTEMPAPGKPVSLVNGEGIGSSDSNGEQAMNPLVAKLLRGEPLPQPQRNINLDLDRILNSAKGPEYYLEQIQICVANPGRFLASWQLLVALFGEAKLYEFIHHSAWTEAELKPFVIQEDEDE